MWNFIKGFFLSGSFLRKLAISIIGISGLIVILAIFTSGNIRGVQLGVALSWMLGHKYKGKAGSALKSIDHVPYWGNKFGLQSTINLLDAERFHPYRMKNGKLCLHLRVSESGRWFEVGGFYYPLYLVKDLDFHTDEIVMIDGTRMPAPLILNLGNTTKGLLELLEANRIYEKGLSRKSSDGISAQAFARAWGSDYEKLAGADWDEVRYVWEKEFAAVAQDRIDRKRFSKFLNGLRQGDIASEALLNRVLSEEEMEVVANAVRRGVIKEDKLTECFDINAYKDEMCVCNGVHLLNLCKLTGIKGSKEFLFDCIKDIQKPYFEEAVQTLKRFQRDELIEEIEKNVARAHEQGDVLWGAGLIYLSKQIDYEISLSKSPEYIPAYETVSAGAIYAQAQQMEKL